MKKIALIGSTGSIGRQAVNVVLRYPDRFRIVAMAANSGGERFEEQLARLRPDFAALRRSKRRAPMRMRTSSSSPLRALQA